MCSLLQTVITADIWSFNLSLSCFRSQFSLHVQEISEDECTHTHTNNHDMTWHPDPSPSLSVPGDVIHHEGPSGPSVIWPGDGPEALLTSRVPNLQLHLLTVDLHDPGPELHPDGVRTVCHDYTPTPTHTHTHTPTHTHTHQYEIYFLVFSFVFASCTLYLKQNYSTKNWGLACCHYLGRHNEMLPQYTLNMNISNYNKINQLSMYNILEYGKCKYIYTHKHRYNVCQPKFSFWFFFRKKEERKFSVWRWKAVKLTDKKKNSNRTDDDGGGGGCTEGDDKKKEGLTLLLCELVQQTWLPYSHITWREEE